MKFFKERKEIEKKYKKWAKKNNVLDCPFSVITFVDCYYGEELEKLKWYKEQYDKMEAVGMTTPAKINKKFDELQHQLVEKDEEIKELKSRLEEEMDYKDEYYYYWQEAKKEIKEYNNYFKSFGCKNFAEFQELIGLTKVSAKDKDRDDLVRHQICEEIRDLLLEKIPTIFLETQYGDWVEILNKIDQIEQGENK